MTTKSPAANFLDSEKTLFKSMDERLRRRYAASLAIRNGTHGVAIVSAAFSMNCKTVYRGIKELREQTHTERRKGKERVRKAGGGRKPILASHPEYIDIFREIVECDIAGLPQDANTKWLRSKPSEIKRVFEDDYHIHISLYVVKQIIKSEGYTHRKPIKDLPMSACENRDMQFRKIAQLRRAQEASGQPILSVDTKKKELVGNFRRGNGRTYSKGPVKTFDHDFESFSSGKIAPYGIYDVGKNVGYLTLGTSHDTAEFACDCIREQWEQNIRHIYPKAKSILILCDGGGSNSARGWLFKHCLIRLARDLGVDIIVAHYPPYCSKWNPIEHKLFSQISRAWEGAIFNSVEEAQLLASKTRTKAGLAVFAAINRKHYETKRERPASFEAEYEKYIVFDKDLPKWNYRIKCC